MSTGDRIKRLKHFYARLPKVACQGKCAGPLLNVCTVVSATELERDRIEAAVGHEALEIKDVNLCPLLKDGKCTVYDIRPTICRMWGSWAFQPPCPYGCKADRTLTRAESMALLQEAVKIGGPAQLIGWSRYMEIRPVDAGGTVTFKFHDDAPPGLRESVHKAINISHVLDALWEKP
jgi:hypothetical protein